MGMFDELRFDDGFTGLPAGFPRDGWQTKDYECVLASLRVDADGQLWCAPLGGLDDTATGACADEAPIDVTGCLRLVGGALCELVATFDAGRLVRLEVVDPGASCLAKSPAELVRRAAAFAEQAHRGQLRDSGEPYFAHPARVADILRQHGIGDHVVIAAAYLHDVVEDTPATIEHIRDEFGAAVATLVDEMTNPAPQSLPFAEKHASLLEHVRTMSPAGKLIKLADRSHNLSECHVWPAWKQVRYARATLELLQALEPWSNTTSARFAAEVRQLAEEILARNMGARCEEPKG